MKQIKFRAWQKNHKRMVEVKNIFFDDNGEINRVSTFVENQVPQYINYRDDLSDGFFLKDERGMVLELMQYTGFNDKNGVEIYEGDVLYFEPYETHINDRVVQNIDGAYHGTLIRSGHSKLLAECFYETKVIGNIYENQLLGEEK